MAARNPSVFLLTVNGQIEGANVSVALISQLALQLAPAALRLRLFPGLFLITSYFQLSCVFHYSFQSMITCTANTATSTATTGRPPR